MQQLLLTTMQRWKGEYHRVETSRWDEIEHGDGCSELRWRLCGWQSWTTVAAFKRSAHPRKNAQQEQTLLSAPPESGCRQVRALQFSGPPAVRLASFYDSSISRLFCAFYVFSYHLLLFPLSAKVYELC